MVVLGLFRYNRSRYAVEFVNMVLDIFSFVGDFRMRYAFIVFVRIRVGLYLGMGRGRGDRLD